MMYMYINRARLTACEVGIFSREISQPSKYAHPLSLRSSLKFIGVFSRDYGTINLEHYSYYCPHQWLKGFIPKCYSELCIT